MLYKLEPILTHPTYQMQEILMIVVNAAVDNIPFSRKIFPQLLQNNWTNNPDFVRKLEGVLYAHISQLDDKEAFRLQFINNNDIQVLCNDTNVSIIDEIDWNREVELKKFFLSCYSRLDSLMFCQNETEQKARKEYDNLFRNKNRYVCPFCGLNRYPNIYGTTRADFDHYIYKGDYPLSSANMANLIPMCIECNRDIKKMKNVLMGDTTRTYAFYPYEDIPDINIKIICNDEPSEENFHKGIWDIEIESIEKNEIIEEKIMTWNRVFEIKQRYINEIKEFHNEWISELLKDNTTVFHDEKELRVFFFNESERLKKTYLRKMKVVYMEIIFFQFMAKNASARFLNRYFHAQNNK